MAPDFYDKLAAFVDRIERERHHKNMAHYSILVESAVAEGRRTYEEFGYNDGKKYVRVFGQEEKDRGRSVHSFVDKETGVIYGAESWRKPNFKRCFGTLDTIDDWNWSGYYAVSKNGQDTLVPKEQRKR